jgi:hypothetical protein
MASKQDTVKLPPVCALKWADLATHTTMLRPQIVYFSSSVQEHEFFYNKPIGGAIGVLILGTKKLKVTCSSPNHTFRSPRSICKAVIIYYTFDWFGLFSVKMLQESIMPGRSSGIICIYLDVNSEFDGILSLPS